MAGKSDEERLAALERQADEIARKRRELQARVRSRQRKADAHRKIVEASAIEGRAGIELSEEQALRLGSIARYLWGPGYDRAGDTSTLLDGSALRPHLEEWIGYAARLGAADYQRARAEGGRKGAGGATGGEDAER